MINTWPSRGYPVTGFEFKSSRSDWLSELNNPAKAEGFVQKCDEWCLVAGAAGVAKKDEVPRGWGLLTVTNGKLRTIVPPTRSAEKPPITAEFLACLLKAYGNDAERDTQKRVRAATAKTIKRYDQIADEDAWRKKEHDLTLLQRQYKRLHSSVTSFHEATGVNVNDFLVKDTAARIKAAVASTDVTTRSRYAQNHLSNALTRAEQACDDLRAIAVLVGKLEHKPNEQEREPSDEENQKK